METRGTELVLVAGLCVHCGPTTTRGDGLADSGATTGTPGEEANTPAATADSTGVSGTETDGDMRADSGEADAGSGTGAPRPHGAVACGEQACEVASEFCLACDHGDQLDAHCLERSSNGLYEELGREFEHGCTAGVSLFIECDESADCGSGAVCRFVSGDFGLAFCDVDRAGTVGQACDDESDCDPVLGCGAHDPLGYFGQYAAVLGWTPQACQP